MRPSVWILVICAAPAARAGHFDDVVDPHPAKPPPCQPRPDDIVPRCPSQVVVQADDRDPPPQPQDNEERLAILAARASAARDDDVPPARTSAMPAAPALVLDDSKLRYHAEVSLGLGGAVVDGVDVSAWPSLNIAGGVQRGRWVGLATYALSAEHYHAVDMQASPLGATSPVYQDTDGIVHKLGLAGRYSFFHAMNEAGYLGDLWLQGDGGEEFTRWDRGGLLARPYFGVGFGIEGGLANAAGRSHSIFVAMRLQFARRSDLDGALATCSAPCTEATPPERWSDRSLEVRLGFAWGE